MFDANMVNLTSSASPIQPNLVPPPAAAPAPVNAPATGSAPATVTSPAPTPTALSQVLAKHGLTDEKALESYLDGLTGLKSKLGDRDPDELMKAYETSQRYEKERARQEREDLKASETPEQTITRLEREMEQNQKQVFRKAEQQRKSQAAQSALENYGMSVDAALRGIPDFPQEYTQMVKAVMGVDSEVNDLDITDRGSVFNLVQKVSKNVMDNFANAVIARYRAGKEAFPNVPPVGGGMPPGGPGENKPKNLGESHMLAGSMLAKHFMNRG